MFVVSEKLPEALRRSPMSRRCDSFANVHDLAWKVVSLIIAQGPTRGESARNMSRLRVSADDAHLTAGAPTSPLLWRNAVYVKLRFGRLYRVDVSLSVANVGPGPLTGSRLGPLALKIAFGSTFASNTSPMKQLLISSQF